jgi:hypothetical protein
MRLPTLIALAVLAAAAAALGRPLVADEVVLTGGTRITGIVLSRDESRLALLLPSGDELALAAGDVKEVVTDPEAPAGEKVTRYRTGAKHPREGLEVALIHMLHPDTGRRVDLVGAVHMGDTAYYREVQRLLEAADVVLYELVRPADGKEPEESEAHPVRRFQQQLAKWFGFAFQMDAIQYDRPHFVHADMTMEQLSAATAKRAEGGPGEDDGEEGPPGVQDLLGGLGGQIEQMQKAFGAMLEDPSPKGQRARRNMKRAFGGLLGAMGGKLGSLLGDDVSDVLLVQRNEIAVQRLVELPPEPKSVAIFYGAAHLPDLEQRLVALGYRRAGARWLLAWNMREEVER